jgi:hypothetical protein
MAVRLRKRKDNVDSQDLRSVLRLFAEVASSVDHDEGAHAPDCHDPEQGGEDLSGVRSSTEGATYRDKCRVTGRVEGRKRGPKLLLGI